MDPVTTVPPDASWQQLVYMIAIAIIPVVIGYLEKIRRDLHDNTEKTDRVNHSLNGELDKRLEKLAQDIGEAIAESHSELENRIAKLEARIFDQQ